MKPRAERDAVRHRRTRRRLAFAAGGAVAVTAAVLTAVCPAVAAPIGVGAAVAAVVLPNVRRR